VLKEGILWPDHRQYKSKTEWEPIGFFSECLFNSERFDLSLGFFSSSAIRTLSSGFAMFLYNGGIMRMIINNILSEKDKAAIEAGLSTDRKSIVSFDLSDVYLINNRLSENDIHFFECLSWLIFQKRIEIKIIIPQYAIGISHMKSGAFYDGQNTVVFNGSCNFTRTALIDNIESIDAFCDWDDDVNKAKVKNTTLIFKNTFSGDDTNVQYLDASGIVTDITNRFGYKSIEELISQEKRIYQRTVGVRPSVKKVFEKAAQRLGSVIEQINIGNENPQFPYSTGARAYQKNAFENWKKNKQCGLFVMATGTGKTITSLNCLLEIYKKTGYYKALILVPSITLVSQWEKECRKFRFTTIIKVCSISSWKDEISNIIVREKISKTSTVSYIVIATYASFVRSNIFSELNQLSSKTLLIADEAHNMGSTSLLNLLPKVVYKRRIGLSATPEHQFDDEGNRELFGFFGSENGYVYEYSMKQAIENRILCRYYYYPHLVVLTDDEMAEYRDISLNIAKYFNPQKDRFGKNDARLTALLLKRKRIIHRAENKKYIFKEILAKQYEKKGDLKYTLVYVPEGNDPNDLYDTYMDTDNDRIKYEDESLRLIDFYTRSVKELDERITVRKFISETDDKENILRQFSNGELDVLTSMRCLDEGMDIPRAELAIFCASTGNPRQFVQRRGRILRTHPEKLFAYIHDLVVIPKVNSNSSNYRMERSILKKELERVRDFALLSENSSDTVTTLLDTMDYYNLNLYSNE
jgi:superfamily II DNA or RNA helicase